MDFALPQMHSFSALDLGLPSILDLDLDLGLDLSLSSPSSSSSSSSSSLSSLSSLPSLAPLPALSSGLEKASGKNTEDILPLPIALSSSSSSPASPSSSRCMNEIVNVNTRTNTRGAMEIEEEKRKPFDMWATSGLGAVQSHPPYASVSPEPHPDKAASWSRSSLSSSSSPLSFSSASSSDNEEGDEEMVVGEPSRKRKRASKSATPVGPSRARKDQLPEDEIERLLRLKPSQLNAEEREIRKRAKNRQSAAVARAKRNARASKHGKVLETTMAENRKLRAKVAALEAQLAALASTAGDCELEPSSERASKRHRALA